MNIMEREARYAAHNYNPLPVVLARGEGAYLWDIQGKRYIDMMSAYSAVSHGHAHPRILAALEGQAHRLSVPSRAYYNDRLGPFLAELCRLTGLDAERPTRPSTRTPAWWSRRFRELSLVLFRAYSQAQSTIYTRDPELA